jgi:dihydropteroate synthase
VGERPPIQLKRATLDWSRTYVMGVVNATPDSFSDGGLDPLRQAHALVEAGADIVDVGGESTRPGSAPVGAAEEIRRLGEPLHGLGSAPVAVSLDTYRAEVADWALRMELAEIINDVSGGLLEPDLLKVVARHRAPVILGHLRGTPADMQSRAAYNDVVREVIAELRERVEAAVTAGVDRARILVDPGIGFAKTAEHNLQLLARLGELRAHFPNIVIGVSRKSFLGKVTGRQVQERELATAAAGAIAAWNGAAVLRVHDVAGQRDAIRVVDAIRRST